MGDEDFTIPDVIDKIPNSPAVHKIPTQAKKYVWVVPINEEDPITYQGALDEIKHHKNPFEKSKINISICIRKSYQRTYLEELWS